MPLPKPGLSSRTDAMRRLFAGVVAAALVGAVAACGSSGGSEDHRRRRCRRPGQGRGHPDRRRGADLPGQAEGLLHQPQDRADHGERPGRRGHRAGRGQRPVPVRLQQHHLAADRADQERADQGGRQRRRLDRQGRRRLRRRGRARRTARSRRAADLAGKKIVGEHAEEHRRHHGPRVGAQGRRRPEQDQLRRDAVPQHAGRGRRRPGGRGLGGRAARCPRSPAPAGGWWRGTTSTRRRT